MRRFECESQSIGEVKSMSSIEVARLNDEECDQSARSKESARSDLSGSFCEGKKKFKINQLDM
ncbi:hypothetical protein PGTUg99_029262 [Puccinia graminis f. sp. tritici]|uniref:Uncharacterized protein n=1 Tax=Puccinia graminis f. sp. tritici TaxID=56615 RepID=A0A5B0MD89_PUCGR|nr:hypothetical protein PGTUg99_029262 [Puccinia graminis f. sp. tritici]